MYCTTGAAFRNVKDALFREAKSALGKEKDPLHKCRLKAKNEIWKHFARYAGRGDKIGKGPANYPIQGDPPFSPHIARKVSGLLKISYSDIAYIQVRMGTVGLKNFIKKCRGVPGQENALNVVD